MLKNACYKNRNLYLFISPCSLLNTLRLSYILIYSVVNIIRIDSSLCRCDIPTDCRLKQYSFHYIMNTNIHFFVRCTLLRFIASFPSIKIPAVVLRWFHAPLWSRAEIPPHADILREKSCLFAKGRVANPSCCNRLLYLAGYPTKRVCRKVVSKIKSPDGIQSNY